MRTTPARPLLRAPANLAVLAALAALLTPVPARAQFQPVRLRLPSWPFSEVVAARLSGLGGGDDLLVLQPPLAPGHLRLAFHGDLATARTPYAGLPPQGGFLAAGRFEPAAPGAAEDLLFSTETGLLARWGAAPDAWQPIGPLFTLSASPAAFGKARLLPRPEPVLLAPLGAAGGTATLWAGDLAAARAGGAVPSAALTIPPLDLAADGDLDPRVYPLRLSPAAVAAGVDDVVMPASQAIFVAWHRTAPGGPSLAQLDLTGVVSGTRGDLTPWLPPGSGKAPGGSVLGAAALDADGDGDPDLVFSYAHPTAGSPELRGGLFYARNDGTPQSLATPPWHQLEVNPDLDRSADPFTLRQLALDPPAVAVFDRFHHAILILRGDARTGFTVLSLPADGGTPVEMFVADLIGSAAPDLVVQVHLTPPAGQPVAEAEVWVYPDVGDAAPTVDFAPPPPAQVLRGQDLPLSVVAADVDSAVAVTWMLGDRFSPPLASGPAWTVPGDLLCQAAASQRITARATDAQGVFAEAGATVEVVTRPSLRLLGDAPDRLALAPGGAAGTAEGSAWPACQRTATFAWGEQGLSGLAEVDRQDGATSSRRRFTIPEGAYPAVLGGAPALTLTATDDLGATGHAVLPLTIDAEGLAEVEVLVDRPALAAGELGLATAHLRSRIGVALPGVRAVVRLGGLALAGPIAATGAGVTAGAAEGEVLLDALPAAGAEVRLAIPVRGLGTPGEVAVELFSSGGHRVTPPASAAAGPDRPPGCGCGAGGDPAGLVLGLAALLGLRPRRRARPPSAT